MDKQIGVDEAKEILKDCWCEYRDLVVSAWYGLVELYEHRDEVYDALEKYSPEDMTEFVCEYHTKFQEDFEFATYEIETKLSEKYNVLFETDCEFMSIWIDNVEGLESGLEYDGTLYGYEEVE